MLRKEFWRQWRLWVSCIHGRWTYFPNDRDNGQKILSTSALIDCQMAKQWESSFVFIWNVQTFSNKMSIVLYYIIFSRIPRKHLWYSVASFLEYYMSISKVNFLFHNRPTLPHIWTYIDISFLMTHEGFDNVYSP